MKTLPTGYGSQVGKATGALGAVRSDSRERPAGRSRPALPGPWLPTCLILGLCWIPAGADEQPYYGQGECTLTAETLALLQNEAYPGLWVYAPNAISSSVYCDVQAFYGWAMSQVAVPCLPADAAEAWAVAWLNANGNVFAVPDLDLQLVRSNMVHPEVLGVVHPEVLTVFAYQQYMEGLRVINGLARLLVRNDSCQVVYVAAHLAHPPSGELRTATVEAQEALEYVQEAYSHLAFWSEPEMVIYYAKDVPALRAWTFTGTNPEPGAAEAYAFFVDATTADTLLGVQDLVMHAGLKGHVSGKATPGTRPDVPENPPVETALPALRVQVGVQVDDQFTAQFTTYTDENGDYFLPPSGTAQVTVHADLSGRWATIFDHDALEPGMSVSMSGVTPPPPDFLFNPNPIPFDIATAQINAYVHMNLAHDFYKTRQPDWDGLDLSLRCRVNIVSSNGSCNAAFYVWPPPWLEFDACGQQGCQNSYPSPNAAYASSIAHEYGHFIVDRLGLLQDVDLEGHTVQGTFGDGFADTFSLLVLDDPIVGRDGYGPGCCNRDYTCDTRRYPFRCAPYPEPCQDPQVHWICGCEHAEPNLLYGCGKLLAYCWQGIARNLQATQTYTPGLNLARQLFTDWSQITLGGEGQYNTAHPLTAIEVLTVDDLVYGDGDLNSNATPHVCEICQAFASHGITCPPPVLLGSLCNSSGLPDKCCAEDECDCNSNGTCDAYDAYVGTSGDCNTNSIPDECEPDEDCNTNDTPDICDIAHGTSHDCQPNGIPDECDITPGTSLDCNVNGTPDECESDCNTNGIPDECDIAQHTSQDCNANGIPDECLGLETDCNSNGVPDACDVPPAGTSSDCAGEGTPDECEPDCNTNSTADSCDILAGTSRDCNANGVPDECDLAGGTSTDCDSDGSPDECSGTDCNFNGTWDACDVHAGTSQDCNSNGIPDECDLLLCTSLDCNTNGIPDECDIARGTSTDVDTNGIPDDCSLTPPHIIALASVGKHNAKLPGWPGGDVALYLDPQTGGIEPRLQIVPEESGMPPPPPPIFLKVTFDTPIDPNTIHVRMIPDPGVRAIGSNGPAPEEVVKIRFFEADGVTPAAVPSGSYRIDLTGTHSSDGVPVSGACPTFPVGFLTGDVNCDGRVTTVDGDVIDSNDPYHLCYAGVNPRADLDRSGGIKKDREKGILAWWTYWECPLASCSSNGPDPNDCNTNGFLDICDVSAGTSLDCNSNGIPDECDIADGTSQDCKGDGTPDECQQPIIPSFLGTAASVGTRCSLELSNGDSEPRSGRIRQLNFDFDCPPSGTVTFQWDNTCPTPAVFVSYGGASEMSCSPSGNDMQCTFAPALEDQATYQFDLSAITDNPPGTTLYVISGLVGDANNSKLVSGADVSYINARWGTADCRADLNENGVVSGADVSVVNANWGHCAPEMEGGEGMMMGGEGGGLAMLEATGGEEGDAGGEPSSPETGPWTYVEAALEFEVQPLGGGEPVAVLAPYSTYELHYTAGYERIGAYVLFAVETSPEQGLTEVTAPASGDWSGTGNFTFVDLAAEWADPLSAPGYPDGYFRTQMAYDGFWPNSDGYAGPQGHLCNFTTGTAGVLNLDLALDWLDFESFQEVTMHAQADLVVEVP